MRPQHIAQSVSLHTHANITSPRSDKAALDISGHGLCCVRLCPSLINTCKLPHCTTIWPAAQPDTPRPACSTHPAPCPRSQQHTASPAVPDTKAQDRRQPVPSPNRAGLHWHIYSPGSLPHPWYQQEGPGKAPNSVLMRPNMTAAHWLTQELAPPHRRNSSSSQGAVRSLPAQCLQHSSTPTEPKPKAHRLTCGTS